MTDNVRAYLDGLNRLDRFDLLHPAGADGSDEEDRILAELERLWFMLSPEEAAEARLLSSAENKRRQA